MSSSARFFAKVCLLHLEVKHLCLSDTLRRSMGVLLKWGSSSQSIATKSPSSHVHDANNFQKLPFAAACRRMARVASDSFWL